MANKNEEMTKASNWILNEMGYSDYDVVEIYGSLKEDFSFVAKRKNEYIKSELHCEFLGDEFRYQEDIQNMVNIAIHILERYK